MAKYTAYDELDVTDTRKPTKKRPRRASLLGFLAVLVGVAAIAVTQRDCIRSWADAKGIQGGEYLYAVKDYPVDPYHVAAAGAGLAIVALLLRKVTGRTRGGWPALALLLSVSAAGIWRYQTTPKDPGTPERWVKDNVVDRVDGWIHPPALPAPAQPAANPSNETVVIAPATQPADPGTSAEQSARVPAKPASKPAQPPVNVPSKVFEGL